MRALAFALALACVLAPQLAHATPVVATADPATEVTGTPETTPTASVSTTHTIGYSARGRRIVLERFGTGPKRLLIVGGIHGTEKGGPVAAKFAAYLRTHPSAIPTDTTIDIVAYSNPDGRALKRRGNAYNIDLNRNFPASNWTHKHARGTLSHGSRPASARETRVMVALLKDRRYARVMSLHSRGGIIDYNGVGSKALARKVARAAHIRIYRLGKYSGSMGSYVPEKFGITLLTWELSSTKLTTNVRSGLLAWVR